MESSFLHDRGGKIQFVNSMLQMFKGLRSLDDELTMFRLFEVMIQKLVNNDAMAQQEGKSADPTVQAEPGKPKGNSRKQERFRKELLEWQFVMFECGMPKAILNAINTSEDPKLSTKALEVLNLILQQASEETLQRFLDLLRDENSFFNLF